MQDTHRIQETYPQEGIDSKAYLLCFLRRIPYMLLIGLTGAIIGSGLYLLIAQIRCFSHKSVSAPGNTHR